MPVICPFCEDPDKKILSVSKVEEHLIVTRDDTNHFHVHGPIRNRALIQDFVTFILKESGIAFDIVSGRPAEKPEDKPVEAEQQQE